MLKGALSNNLAFCLPSLFVASLAFTRMINWPIVGHRVQLPELLFCLLLLMSFHSIRRRTGSFRWLDLISISLIGFLFLHSILSVSTSIFLEALALLYLYAITVALRTFPISNSNILKTIIILGSLAASLGVVGWILACLGEPTRLAWPRTIYYPYLGYVGRAQGLNGHPNMLMSLLAFCSIFLFTTILSSDKEGSTSKMKLALGIILLAIGLTFSKAILLLGIVLLWTWMKMKQIGSVIRLMLNLTIALGLLAYIFATHILVIQPKQVDWSALQSRAYTLNDTFYQNADFGLVWTNYAVNKKTAFQAFLDKPIRGIGPGKYSQYVNSLKSKGNYPVYFPDYDPHCNLLGFSAEGGVLAFMLLLGLMVALYREWSATNAYNPQDKAFKIAFAALFWFFILEGINTDNLHFRHYWVGVGLFLSWKRKLEIEAQVD